MKLGLPPRWHYCPKHGEVINDLFLPMKTPLSEGYDDLLETEYRFHPDDVFKINFPDGLKPKLWLNLANTERFYGRKQVTNYNCEYIHMPLIGHNQAPTKEEVDRFCRIVNGFRGKNEPGLIVLHCTHGFNRTGFLISAALVELFNWDAESAINEFARARPRGIYKEDYLRAFFERFDSFWKPDDPLPVEPPGRPAWEDGPDTDMQYERLMNQTNGVPQNRVPQFMDGQIPNCNFVQDMEQRKYLQEKVREYMQAFSEKKLKDEFPGSQPVSMDHKNIQLLGKEMYWVSWKADGMRYLVLINDENEVYAFDRDNNVFELPLRFPRVNKLDEHIADTLIDCEVIIDKQDGNIRPRMLIYDLILLEKELVGKEKFGKRFDLIRTNIVKPLEDALKTGKMSVQVMSVRRKDFFFIVATSKVLQMRVGHHVDGLIFQPNDDKYTPGRFNKLLKWKPVEESSVDFKLVMERHVKEGHPVEWKAALYVLGLASPFAYMDGKKSLKQYDGKIVECTFNVLDGKWHFMRERTDKSHPNALSTAISVCETIKNPLSQNVLLDFINRYGYQEGKPIRLPPAPPSNGRQHNNNPQLSSMVL